MEYRNKVIEGDCLEQMAQLPDDSIDMVLCDLPYGTTQNPWDSVIDLDKLWEQYKRIVKPDGIIVLTGQGKFTGQLIMSNPNMFKYKLVWIKAKATNFLNANKQPLRRHEDICIFYKKQPRYNPQKIPGRPYDRGFRGDNRSGNYGTYGRAHIKSQDGMRHPTDVIFIEEQFTDWVFCQSSAKEGAYHPTQKPVNLGRWLIRTYTKPGDLVLDNACGSGSFLVAAILEKRDFIGIEKNENCYHIQHKKVDLIKTCNTRIDEAFRQINLEFEK